MRVGAAAGDSVVGGVRLNAPPRSVPRHAAERSLSMVPGDKGDYALEVEFRNATQSRGRSSKSSNRRNWKWLTDT